MSISVQLSIISALIRWSQLYLNDAGWSPFRANQSVPQVKAMGWHLVALEPSPLHAENFSKGTLGAYRPYFSGPQLKETNKLKQSK